MTILWEFPTRSEMTILFGGGMIPFLGCDYFSRALTLPCFDIGDLG
jgi:hypothetical protein